MCAEQGIHQSADDCIDALRAMIDQLTTARANLEPSVAYLGRWVPAFYP